MTSIPLVGVKQFFSSVRRNVTVAESYSLLEFDWPSETGAEHPVPGQFITIRNRNATDPLLRRPFAVSAFDADSGTCEIIYQIRGKSTQALSACRKGDRIDIIGPLGNGFPLPEPGCRPYLLAGGIGFGPVYFFAKRLVEEGGCPVTIIGARTRSLIPDVPYTELQEGNARLYFCTDDGSKGFHGTAIDMIESIGGLRPDNTDIYACGPRAMLAGAATFSEAAGITCWVSVEQVIGCGVGACMGCVIRAREPGKFLRVCTEGPVFNAKDIEWK